MKKPKLLPPPNFEFKIHFPIAFSNGKGKPFLSLPFLFNPFILKP